MKRIKTYLLMAALAAAGQASAQLSTNPDKFLGNITTGWTGSMDVSGYPFYQYWNQVTCENATKWGSVEGTRGTYNWSAADNAARYAKQHNFPFKFHTLVWGSQFPDWFKTIDASERYEAIEKWMDAVKEHYPDLELIDVVNEAINGHQKDTPLMRNALGGAGQTGYDWIIKAFEMAYERWPNAILIYNDFNTFQWNTNEYITLVKRLRDMGAPIDAYGCQSHDLGGVNGDTFGAVMQRIQDALKMPMYITEYDIADANDANQKWNYMQQFPLMWEADYCAGVTLWGWVYGKTWTTDGNSGLIRNGAKRSAMKWLEEYMATDKAKNVKSPFPGMKKEASVYIKPEGMTATKGEKFGVEVRAKMRTKVIECIELYADGELQATLTSEPYTTEVTPQKQSYCELKAVVKTTDGEQYTRYGGFSVIQSTGLSVVDGQPSTTETAYDLFGRQVKSGHKGLIISNGRKEIK